MEKLIKAIQEGNEGDVGRLLEEDLALLEMAVDEGFTPLLLAAKHRHLGLVRLLVQRGANINATDRDGCTALHSAAFYGHEDLVALLLSKGAQPNHSGVGNMTPLIWACLRGCVGVVRLLVEHTGGEGLEDTDHMGMTALHWAASNGHGEVVVFLMSQGAQATSVCRTGDTPLMLACKDGQLGVVEGFFEHLGLQGLEHRTDTGLTPLHCAAQAGREEVVAFLLSKGVRTPVDESYRTPLMVAAGQNRLGVVKMLLQHTGGEGLEDWDEDGRTALQLAAVGGHEEVVAFLLSQGAEADIPESDDKTPLMDACHFGHVGVVRLLVQHMGGKGLENRDDGGRTALHWAAFGSPAEVLRFLLLSGADPTVMDHEGRTPRAEAVKSEDQVCIAVFEVSANHVLSHLSFSGP
jgi:ankyrin repeat protein